MTAGTEAESTTHPLRSEGEYVKAATVSASNTVDCLSLSQTARVLSLSQTARVVVTKRTEGVAELRYVPQDPKTGVSDTSI
jgi:hypothetical protein